MDYFKAIGTVPDFNTDNNEFSLRVDNSDELVVFFKTKHIDTKLNYIEGKASIKVRGTLAY